MSPVEVSAKEPNRGAVPVEGVAEKLACGGTGAVTVTAIDLLSVPPWLSVTEAVIMCDPTGNELTLTAPPVPMSALSDFHCTLDARLPSSRSVAVPVRFRTSPTPTSAPFAGDVIVTMGVALTTTVTEDVTGFPPVSVTDAVMTCDPADNELVLVDAPVPRAPSWLELHWIAADKSPSSESLTVPVKVTASPECYPAPAAGAVMATAGGAMTTIALDA